MLLFFSSKFATMKATRNFVFFVVLSIFSAAESSSLLKFKARQEDANINKLMAILDQPTMLERDQPIDFFWKWGMDPNKRLIRFSWKDCGNSSSKVKMNDVHVTPDPIVLPGTVNIAFNLSISDDFPDSITGDVVMKKKIGPIYIEIPCVDNVGSCHYDDLCNLLSQITTCPDPFIKHNIPCKCPFKKGTYFLPPSEFKITSFSVPTGDYSIKLTLTRKGAFMGCLSLKLSLKER